MSANNNVVVDARMVKKQAVDRLMKQFEAEQNPMYGLMAAIGGGSAQHHKLADIILIITDEEARTMLTDRLNETYA